MMGTHHPQKDLFVSHIDLDKRVWTDHPLRHIQQHVDFSFVREEVSDFYGHNGNESVDPAVIMKMIANAREEIREGKYVSLDELPD